MMQPSEGPRPDARSASGGAPSRSDEDELTAWMAEREDDRYTAGKPRPKPEPRPPTPVVVIDAEPVIENGARTLADVRAIYERKRRDGPEAQGGDALGPPRPD